MAYEIVWETEALASVERYLDDRDGLVAVFAAVDALADDPRPRSATAWGHDHWRFRVGDYRVLYRVSDSRVSVTVVHLGHAP